MTGLSTTRIPQILERDEAEVLERWLREQLAATAHRSDLIAPAQLREQSREFLALFRQAATRDTDGDVRSPVWSATRGMLEGLSAARGTLGFSPSETATFIFSLKTPLFERLRETVDDARGLADAMVAATAVIDALGLYTTEVHQKNREGVIARQQEEMLELSTPVVKLWDGILALPMIGTLDSARTQVVMETLLERIVETGAEVAIIDITGVPTVDTLVAQHLLKTITAARLMGADCIISGIRPQIAATIVHLGVDLSQVITKATLADAFALALKRIGLAVGRPAVRVGAGAAPAAPAAAAGA
ncbi:MAG TPA: STAS domain-containing protein [Gemmatimonadales bacterium]|nr:STAS domain-containing protein [Gemmatimonadales bacterium]